MRVALVLVITALVVAFQCGDSLSFHRAGSNCQKAKIEVGERMLGYTLIVYQLPKAPGNDSAKYAVAELDAAKTVRWKFEVVGSCEAQVIGPNRVLVAERTAQRVTERDFEGKILWE